ncbi:NUDIX domain-containing protein [Pseudoalteromonas ruthenica]|uniref:ADP-ribose pyrophosphatase n=1 Tax=Pseudoalteromonas ruthenica TaxID=151081 RepID=A0A5S3Z5W0_9GAMM|nr:MULTISPECIES: NUDIX domain-containing protein [Pseudoalteromonas]RZF77652.1 NUDIX domain-containing protein [Pseudoalteromonas sp. CO325X]TLX51517.1 NUDIX domain-containing protein [Pseudoalteromonas ruthenica]TMO45721.1 NUDIX domain-containing protein [Pseudoalteromonas ruthenica]TMO50747.1 NUDIX domain-containing protein [Pseudoalteromonas ruthenica]TMP87245.1 NUDIX domain-containing protein [Pseudoalteromonas ruthenica]
MNKINQFDKGDVTIESTEEVFKGFFKIDKYRFKHALFAGGTSATIEREIFERGHAVAVLPYDPATRSVLLVEQIRIGALATKDNPWLLECIAGMADGSEDYPAVVRKEAQEEAGLELQQLDFMLSYLSSPGGTTERLYLYLAQTDLSGIGGTVHGLDDEGEDIKVHVMAVDEAMARLNNGEIDNAATVISLQWLALNEQRIQQQWGAE